MSILLHQQLLCSALEVIINKALALNTHGSQTLAKLELHTLCVHLSELGFPVNFTVSANKVLVNSSEEFRSDDELFCRIDTSLSTLQQLKREQQLTELIKQEKLDILGNIKIAQQFASIMENIDIDWQTELAKHIGDVATYKTVQAGKFVADKVNFAAQQIQADASEWLIHEKQLVVTKNKIDDFNQQVNEVSAQTEQLSKRLEKLHQQLSALAGEQG
ncbi:SCP2 domain-containing protein [Colwelliaceae bacterium 6471]